MDRKSNSGVKPPIISPLKKERIHGGCLKFCEVIVAGLAKVNIKKIEKLLMQRGLNYTTLGKKMGGISGSAVSEMFMQINKQGRLLRYDTVYRLAKALEVEPETILAVDDDALK